MTRVPFLDLARHVAAIREEIDNAVSEVLDSGRFVGGEPVERFERKFAAWCGTTYAIGVASGTDAITIALQAVGVGPGDEVITVANTCVPTVVGIEQTGATPVLVDPDRRAMTIDPESVAAAITPRTRAIVPVHLYGRCAEMRPLLELAHAHDLKLVEDCAQAHGATYEGAAAGTMGDAAAFSFYPTKNLGALGDGGAVATNTADVDRAARRIRSYGESRQYDSICRGRNSRLDTVQAAVLEVKLGHLDDWIDRRRAIAAAYHECAAEAGLEGPVDGAASRHAYHLYVVAVADRDAFRARLASAGVETLVHYPRAVHQHPAYANLTPHGGLPVSEALVRRVVSLPLYPEMSDVEVELVTAALSQAATGT